MKNRLPPIFWIETLLAALAAFLAVVASLWPDWIERVLPIDPDHHSGATEWNLVFALSFAAVLLMAFAFRNWRKASLSV